MFPSKLTYTNNRGDTVSVGDIIYTGNRFYGKEQVGFVTAILKQYHRWRIYVQPYGLENGATTWPLVCIGASDYNMRKFGPRPFNASEV